MHRCHLCDFSSDALRSVYDHGAAHHGWTEDRWRLMSGESLLVPQDTRPFVEPGVLHAPRIDTAPLPLPTRSRPAKWVSPTDGPAFSITLGVGDGGAGQLTCRRCRWSASAAQPNRLFVGHVEACRREAALSTT